MSNSKRFADLSARERELNELSRLAGMLNTGGISRLVGAAIALLQTHQVQETPAQVFRFERKPS